MKYFIDFEAAQFTNEIIAIGCVREDGKEFHSYVKAERKITEFITQLTGITQEMVDSAPTSDEVFREFYQWLKGDNNITFYCYGNSDIDFVKKNLKNTVDFEAQAALSMIGMGLRDFAPTVKKHFGLIKSIGLVKVLAFYRGVDEIHQSHDPLEDARFLQELYNYIVDEGDKFTGDECPFPEYKLVQSSIVAPKKSKTKIVVDRVERWNDDVLIATYCNMEDAVQGAVKLMPKKNRVLALEHKKRVENKIVKSHTSKKQYLGNYWKVYASEVDK